MNARKAIELKFADGIIEEEKKTQENAAYSFSSKQVAENLINKISAKLKPETKEPVKTGRLVNTLKTELYKIKI